MIEIKNFLNGTNLEIFKKIDLNQKETKKLYLT